MKLIILSMYNFLLLHYIFQSFFWKYKSEKESVKKLFFVIQRVELKHYNKI